MNRNIVLILALLLLFPQDLLGQKTSSESNKTVDTPAIVTSDGNGELTTKNLLKVAIYRCTKTVVISIAGNG
jgi:hypothetical protein